MASAYMFCLVFGGALGLLSAVGDFFGDADVPVDVDADLDVDSVADLSDALTTDADVGYLASLFSVRALIFAVLGFGATGTLLTWLGGDAASATTIGLAVTAGLGVGAVVGSFLGFLKRSDTGPRLTESTFAGLTGRVALPLAGDAPGRIVVTRGNREHTVRALPYPHDDSTGDRGDPGEWSRVMVVEMRDGVAYVDPLDDEDAGLIGPSS